MSVYFYEPFDRVFEDFFNGFAKSALNNNRLTQGGEQNDQSTAVTQSLRPR